MSLSHFRGIFLLLLAAIPTAAIADSHLSVVASGTRTEYRANNDMPFEIEHFIGSGG